MNPALRGLGLPATPYNRFADLLSIASGGASNCHGGPYCWLVNSCDRYAELWNYQFAVTLANQENSADNSANRTMYVPLATFAANTDAGNCRIYVEKFDSSQKQIVLGGMFFQSFFYQQTAINAINQVARVILERNFNALNNAFVTNFQFPMASSSAFVVEPAYPQTSTAADSQPTFAASVGGLTNNLTYTFDYTSD